MRRPSVRAMRPDGYDPWQHNQDQAARRTMRRFARFGDEVHAFGRALDEAVKTH